MDAMAITDSTSHGSRHLSHDIIPAVSLGDMCASVQSEDAMPEWMWSILPSMLPPPPPCTEDVINPEAGGAAIFSEEFDEVDPYWEHLFAMAPKLTGFVHRHLLSIRHPRQAYWKWGGAFVVGGDDGTPQRLAHIPLQDLPDAAPDDDDRWVEAAEAHEPTTARDFHCTRRQEIIESPEFVATCKRWWLKLHQTEADATRSRAWTTLLTRSAFCYGEAKLYAELLGQEAEFLFVDAMIDDFMLDSQEGANGEEGISFEKYCEGLFELADTWTSTCEHEEYVALLADLLVRCFPVNAHTVEEEMSNVRRVVILNPYEQQKLVDAWDRQTQMKRALRRAKYFAIVANPEAAPQLAFARETPPPEITVEAAEDNPQALSPGKGKFMKERGRTRPLIKPEVVGYGLLGPKIGPPRPRRRSSRASLLSNGSQRSLRSNSMASLRSLASWHPGVVPGAQPASGVAGGLIANSMRVQGHARRPQRAERLRIAQIAHWHGYSRIAQQSAVLVAEATRARFQAIFEPSEEEDAKRAFIRGAWRPQQRGTIVSRLKESKLRAAGVPQEADVAGVAELTQAAISAVPHPLRDVQHAGSTTLPLLPCVPPAAGAQPAAQRYIPHPPSSKPASPASLEEAAVLTVAPAVVMPVASPQVTRLRDAHSTRRTRVMSPPVSPRGRRLGFQQKKEGGGDGGGGKVKRMGKQAAPKRKLPHPQPRQPSALAAPGRGRHARGRRSVTVTEPSIFEV